MGHRYILAVETSCDDTGIAISCNHRILSNITLSSQTKHKQYGGIVPEIAARSHADNLSICCEQAMQQAKIGWTQLTHIAYTDAPGLPGSLHTGKIFAKSLAQLLKLPIIPVNHIHGHIYSFMIDKNKVVTYPFMSIVLSGGHTCIYLVKNIDHLEILNETADDAIGETLDKVGRILGFNYPGGVSIDQAFNAQKAHLKLIHHFKPEEKFSFSGVKTHITNLANQSKMKHQKLDKISVASSLLQ
jgi:N6-L-threonylcarbamoyladenine synthase